MTNGILHLLHNLYADYNAPTLYNNWKRVVLLDFVFSAFNSLGVDMLHISN